MKPSWGSIYEKKTFIIKSSKNLKNQKKAAKKHVEGHDMTGEEEWMKRDIEYWLTFLDTALIFFLFSTPLHSSFTPAMKTHKRVWCSLLSLSHNMNHEKNKKNEYFSLPPPEALRDFFEILET